VGARPVQPRVPVERGLSRASARRGAGGWWRPAAMGLLAVGLLACGRAPVREQEAATGEPQAVVDGKRAIGAEPTEPVHAAVAAARARAAAPEPWAATPRAERFEMTFVGDVILGRYRDSGYDPIPDGEHEVFGEVAALLRSDLVVGNLETPLVHTLPAQSPVGSRYSFGADAALAQHLLPAGFHALSLANNHAYDLLATGVEETPEILAELGIMPLGAARFGEEPYRVETIEREGWRVGFIAITAQSNVSALAGMPPLPLVETADIVERIVPLVEDARASHDLVVVLAHWGLEYADEPDWMQQQAARALVEAGADLVIGHHPHVLQGIEQHGHGLIAYSLGNFLFENVKEIPRLSGVLRVRYDARGCLEAVVFHPVFVKSVPIKHPAPATGYMGQKIKERVRSLGQRWGTRFGDEGDDLVLEGLRCPPGAPGPA
jgi:Bacterial capsule synthesis protein PGA_cap